MKVAIMQPYFLPYIGYWQLISSVDVFVVYDNIQYTKKGWFNRNRMLEIDHDRLFSIPLKKASDYLDVRERELSDDSKNEIGKILRAIQANYRKAPYYNDAYPVIEACFLSTESNLFNYIHHSIKAVCEYLDITTEIVISSSVHIDHQLKAEDKVMAICKALGANTYINASGGKELYDKATFTANGLQLQFINSEPIEYDQLGRPFVPWLSILDIIMFNSKDEAKLLLQNFTLE